MEKDKSKIKSMKLDSKSKTGKILMFILAILVLSLGAYVYKQQTKPPIEEPEKFIPLDSTKEEYLVEEEEEIVEAEDVKLEVKVNLEDKFRLKSEYEQDILNNNDFDEFSSTEFVDDNMPKDIYSETERKMNSLVKEFRAEEGLDLDEEVNEIIEKAESMQDELEKEIKKMSN